MECYRVVVPDGVKLVGVTAGGEQTSVLPGEYLVHRLPARLKPASRLLRFVGADAKGRDVHVPDASVRACLAPGIPEEGADS
jgi:hypothetical protein